MSWTMHDNTSAVNEAKSQPVKALSLIVCTLSIITIDWTNDRVTNVPMNRFISVAEIVLERDSKKRVNISTIATHAYVIRASSIV